MATDVMMSKCPVCNSLRMFMSIKKLKFDDKIYDRTAYFCGNCKEKQEPCVAGVIMRECITKKENGNLIIVGCLDEHWDWFKQLQKWDDVI